MQPKSSLTAWERWELASFDPASRPAEPPEDRSPPPPPLITPEELDALRESARREGREAGYAAGKADGFQAGREEALAAGREEALRIAALADKLERSLEGLDQAVADDLLALALEVARQVVRQEVAARPELIVAVIKEALLQLPVQHAAIHLHPEDASLVRGRVGDQLAHAGHRIHEDPRLQRGDVVIESGGSHLDATLATRWRRVVEGLGQTPSWQTEEAAP